MKKRVMCFGTFDILHPGHVKFLSAARALGDELIVVISQDKRRTDIRGNTPVNNQKERCLMVGSLKPVSKALLGHKTDILDLIKRYKPAVIALGHDQEYGVDALKAWCKEQKNPPAIKRLKSFNRARYSTSRIKKELCQ